MNNKKHYFYIGIVISILLTVVFFLFLPIEVGGTRAGSAAILLANAGFLAVTMGAVIVFVLVLITDKHVIKNQLITFVRFRHLLKLMIKRDFVTRYRRSVFGVLWSLLNPLLTMFVLAMVFSMLFFHMGIDNFPVYFLSGQLIFGFFSEATTQAMGSVTAGAATIRKVYVPKYIFPLSKVLSSLVNLGFSFVAFLFMFVVTGGGFYWTMLLVPIPILYAVVFSLGVGMLLSAMAVFFKDITYIYGIGVTLLMFLTPIMYPVSILPDRVYYLIHLNPLFHFVSYFRSLALDGVVPGLWPNIACLGFAIGALVLGLYVKLKTQDKYILHL